MSSSFQQQLLQAAHSSSKASSDSDIVKFSALIGLAGGLASSLVYYALQKTVLGPKEDELITLKKNLL